MDNRQQQQIAGIRERQESAMRVMTVMLMVVVSGMQPLPLIKSTGLNGLHGPWVTDSVPQQFVSLTVALSPMNDFTVWSELHRPI